MGSNFYPRHPYIECTNYTTGYYEFTYHMLIAKINLLIQLIVSVILVSFIPLYTCIYMHIANTKLLK